MHDALEIEFADDIRLQKLPRHSIFLRISLAFCICGTFECLINVKIWSSIWLKVNMSSTASTNETARL